MRALTVMQPWAWSILYAGKDVENRTQLWKHRGDFAVHAGSRTSERGFEHPLYEAAMSRETSAVRHRLDVRSAIIGVVELVDAHPAEAGCCDSPWAESSYDEHGGRTRRDVVHLEVARPRPLIEPVPVSGRLGLWTLPDDVAEQVADDLARQTWAS